MDAGGFFDSILLTQKIIWFRLSTDYRTPEAFISSSAPHLHVRLGILVSNTEQACKSKSQHVRLVNSRFQFFCIRIKQARMIHGDWWIYPCRINESFFESQDYIEISNTNGTIRLNGYGITIWKMLDGKHTIESIVERISSSLDACISFFAVSRWL